MPCIKAFLLASVQFFGNILPLQRNQQPLSTSIDFSTLDLHLDGDFNNLLRTLPEESLKVALHRLPTFKDGIFEKNRKAIEAIHSTNPSMATKLLAAAKYDLVRRQNGNISTPATPTPPPPTVIVPVPITTTNSAGSVQVTTVTAVSSATASVVVPVTTTNRQGQTTVVQSSVPAVVVTSNGQVTTQPAPTVGTAGVVLTETNAQGSTFLTTFTPSGGVVSSLVLETTTLPDGSRRTITSFAVVPAATGGASPSGPKLQGSASRPAALTIQGLLVLALTVGALLI